MFALIDNYDSFTYNLHQYLLELGVEVDVYRNDAIDTGSLAQLAPEGIIISPGPATPDAAGICLDLVKTLKGRIPIFGVCLGHQVIGQTYGARITRAPVPVHGKVSNIYHGGVGIFRSIPSPFQATRYHSLIVESESVLADLEATAHTADGLVMGLADTENTIFGVQFHPESIASEYGHKMLENFVKLCQELKNEKAT